MAMENQRPTHLLNLAHFCQSKDMEELRHSLLYATLELETTRAAAQEEIRRRDEQLLHLGLLLDKTIKEKEDAQEKSHKLTLENFLLQQQHQQQQQLVPPPTVAATAPLSGASSVEDGPPPPPPPPPPGRNREGTDRDANGFSSMSMSDSDESIVSSPHAAAFELVPEKPLPEKGKLLQAVMKAGPLLQTLLLAGPLPQWRHPPPPLEPFNIPPVGITTTPPQVPLVQGEALLGIGCRKRGFPDRSNVSPTETKFQRLVPN
ncbi:hypothetical protein MLD38_017265 [Melastoma candidum]|uniref:Uncharacterized protein n=1 Tax=Melastoma candidum TaxID=119954 RepID=A0ACB9QQ28_9MYRT|nr:hypothetical protein MLD38_017265 [Melastoma candidum]